jgi:Kef-type K+ transport system membrane component KefB
MCSCVVAGTLFPVLLGWGLLTACGFSSIEAFASGTALSATAIGFALRLLQDLGMQNTPQGQLITAAALIDDVLSLIVLVGTSCFACIPKKKKKL